MTVWKVSWNKKLVDVEIIREAFMKNDEFTLHQSKGRAKMVKVPKKGDKIVFIYDKREVFEGIVVREFQDGTLHQHQHCFASRSGNENHRIVKTYATVKITGIGSGRSNRGVQRTWSKYRVIDC
jgi:signal peptidase I